MTRNKAEEIVRKAEALTVGQLLTYNSYELFALEQELQEVIETHKNTHLATIARNITLIIGGRY